MTVIEALFETNYGTFWTVCDDCSTPRTLPFAFPFYGASYTIGHVGTNGYITFDSGDSTYTETVPGFNTRKRISAFFDDLIGGGGVWINDQLPGRFIVTYDRTRHYSFGGSNTLQIQLYADGRVVFAYKGITALTSGTITGLTPGPNSPFQQVDFSTQTAFDVPAATAVYEYFTSANPFDLDNGFIVFVPAAAGGYHVRTILAPQPLAASTLTGEVAANGNAAALSTTSSAPAALRAGALAATATSPTAGATAVQGKDIANAEVAVTSSSRSGWVGMTNTDAQGRFSLAGVPAGGIEVTVRRNGTTIARGAAVFPGGRLSEAQLLRLELVSPEVQPKMPGAEAR